MIRIPCHSAEGYVHSSQWIQADEETIPHVLLVIIRKEVGSIAGQIPQTCHMCAYIPLARKSHMIPQPRGAILSNASLEAR